MGRILGLLHAATGEETIHSAIGRWRVALSETLDNLTDLLGDILEPPTAGINKGLLNAAAGEETLHSAIGRWRQAVSETLDQLLSFFDMDLAGIGPGTLLALLNAAAGEEPLHSAIGQWRLSVSTSADELSKVVEDSTLYSFENLTDFPQTITGLSFFGGPLTTSVSLKPHQTKILAGFDPRFISLTGNFFALDGSLNIGTLAAVRTHVSLAPSPIVPPTGTLIRASFTAAETLTPAEVNAISNAMSSLGNFAPGLISNAATPQYDFVQTFVLVDPGGTWIDFGIDFGNGATPVDPRNGQIHLAISYRSMVGPEQQVVPVKVRVLPFRDLNGSYSVLPLYVDDTWQTLPNGIHPELGEASLLSNGKVIIAHGPQGPLEGIWASDQTDIFNPANSGVAIGPSVTTPRFYSGFSEKSVACSDGKHRTHSHAGFSTNDCLGFSSGLSLITEAYTEENGVNGSWASRARLHYGGSAPATPFIIGAQGLVDINGNLGFSFGPNMGPVPGLPSLSSAPGPGEIITPAMSPGPFPLPGQHYWTSAILQPFPPNGFDVFTLFSGEAGLFQIPAGFQLFFPLGPGSFTVDPSTNAFWFSAADAGKRCMTVTHYNVGTTPSADSPNAAGYTRINFGLLTLADGRRIAIGGVGSNNYPGYFLAQVAGVPEILDPSTGLWQDAAPMPIPVWGIEISNAVVHPNGNIYVIGGLASHISFAPVPFPISDKVQVYTPAPAPGLGSWVVTASSFPPGGWCGNNTPIVLNDGDILVAGGFQGAAMDCLFQDTAPGTTASWRYRPSTDTWTQVGDMKAVVCNEHMYKLANGKVLVIGGESHVTGAGAKLMTPQVQIFDPTTNSWTLLKNIPAQFGNHWSPSVLLPNGKLLHVDGRTMALRLGDDVNSLHQRGIGQGALTLSLYCPPRT